MRCNQYRNCTDSNCYQTQASIYSNQGQQPQYFYNRSCQPSCYKRPQPPCCHCYYPPYKPPYHPGTLPGGYTDFRPLTRDAYYVFQNAVEQLTGVTYTPVAFQSQIVNGINYTFIAKATTSTNPPSKYYVLITAYQAPNGTVTLDDITPLVK